MSEEIIEYINTTLRWKAILMCKGNRFDADDLVQETFLRWLKKPDYEQKQIGEKKKLAATIISNVWYEYKGLKYKKWKYVFDVTYPENLPDIKSTTQPEEIDYTNLLLYMKERNDFHVNCFWLFYIGYDQTYIANLYGVEPKQIRSIVHFGKKKLQKILKGLNVNYIPSGVKLLWRF